MIGFEESAVPALISLTTVGEMTSFTDALLVFLRGAIISHFGSAGLNRAGLEGVDDATGGRSTSVELSQVDPIRGE